MRGNPVVSKAAPLPFPPAARPAFHSALACAVLKMCFLEHTVRLSNTREGPPGQLGEPEGQSEAAEGTLGREPRGFRSDLLEFGVVAGGLRGVGKQGSEEGDITRDKATGGGCCRQL